MIVWRIVQFLTSLHFCCQNRLTHPRRRCLPLLQSRKARPPDVISSSHSLYFLHPHTYAQENRHRAPPWGNPPRNPSCPRAHGARGATESSEPICKPERATRSNRNPKMASESNRSPQRTSRSSRNPQRARQSNRHPQYPCSICFKVR